MSGMIIDHDENGPAQGSDRLMLGINYGLMLVGNIIGVTTLVALIIAYARREGSPGWIRSHYEFQIATFWGALIGIVICTVLVLTVVFSIFGVLGYVAIWLWVFIRNCVGLLRLLDGRGMGNPRTMWV